MTTYAKEQFDFLTERQFNFLNKVCNDTNYSMDSIIWAWKYIDEWFDWNDYIDGYGMEDYVTVYARDLAYAITEIANNDGYVDHPDRSDAWEWMANHLEDCATYWDWEYLSTDEHSGNPFSDPEGYQVKVLIQLVAHIIETIPWIYIEPRMKLVLTPEMIKKLRYELCLTDEKPA